jgi:hypothetical protein
VDRCPLSLDRLRSPWGILEWFKFAMGRGWVEEFDRLRVFTAACSVVRRFRKLDSPEGAFVRIVKRRVWGAASQADEDVARKMLITIDRQEPQC